MENVVVAGAGGLVYHGIMHLTKFLRKRDFPQLTLADADVVTAANLARQWFQAKEPKVLQAQRLLTFMGYPAGKLFVCQEFLSQASPLMKQHQDLVLVLADNHLTRVSLFDALKGQKTMFVSGGNTLENGWAAGVWLNTKANFISQYMRDEAQREVDALAHPASCGSLGTSAVDSQSIEGNVMTSLLVYRVLDELYETGIPGVRWDWRITPLGVVMERTLLNG